MMKGKILFVILIFLTVFFVCFSQSGDRTDASGSKPTNLKDNIIEPSSSINQIADCFQFTEGPVSDKQGNIYFSDIFTSRIYIWSVDEKFKQFREPSGRANGMRFDSKENLVVCEGASRSVISTTPDGKKTVLIDQYLGKKLNSPNDLWIENNNNANFADSLYKEEQDTRALYYLPPDGKSLRRVAEDFINQNGVLGTLDGQKLYVSDTEKKEIYVFDILSDGSLSNRKVFLSKYSDGMTLAEHNNLYITNGGIEIYTPEGVLMTTIDYL